MLADIPVSVTPVALLLAAVWLVFTGRLVPHRHFKDKANEVEHWRNAYLEEFSAHRKTCYQLQESMARIRPPTRSPGHSRGHARMSDEIVTTPLRSRSGGRAPR